MVLDDGIASCWCWLRCGFFYLLVLGICGAVCAGGYMLDVWVVLRGCGELG